MNNNHDEEQRALVPSRQRTSAPFMVIDGRFALGRLITIGSTCLVHSGMDYQSFDSEVAIKFSHNYLRLRREVHVYTTLSRRIRSLRGYAQVLYCRPRPFGRMRSGVIVCEKLGQSLAMAMKPSASHPNRTRTFLTERTLEVGRSLIRVVRSLHAINYIHTDINPTHILFGGSDLEHHVYLIGLGAAMEISNGRRSQNLQPRVELAKNEYSSAARMLGKAASIRDDLESIAFVLVAMEKGSLPWSEGARGKSGRELENYLKSAIPLYTAEQICGYADTVGLFLVTYLHYVRRLRPDDNPDYNFLINSLRMGGRSSNESL